MITWWKWATRNRLLWTMKSTGGNANDHAGDAENRIDVRACSHGEEMVQPNHEGQDADRERREDHRPVAEQWLAREGRNHLRINAERGQDENVDLRMPPNPDQIHVQHRVAAAVVG